MEELLYCCSGCGRRKTGAEMYKIVPLTICIGCFRELPRVTQSVFDWTREGWAKIKEEIVPQNEDLRLGADIVGRG